MPLSYKDIFAVVSTIDDCLMLDEEGSTQIEAEADTQENIYQLVFSRKLQAGKLEITIDEELGSCRYILCHQNTAASTMAPSGGFKAIEFDMESETITSNDELRSAIREIVRLDRYNAKQKSHAI